MIGMSAQMARHGGMGDCAECCGYAELLPLGGAQPQVRQRARKSGEARRLTMALEQRRQENFFAAGLLVSPAPPRLVRPQGCRSG